MTLGDLRTASDLGRSALEVRTADDVGALLRRVRHLIVCDALLLHQIHAAGITEWTEPGPAPTGPAARLAASDAISGSVVHVSLWRVERPFGERDHQLLSLLRPYVAAAAVIVGCPNGVADQHQADVDLTSREAQVLSLVTDGATNKDVARQLGISARTVQKHLEHIYDKVGTHRRTAAASWFANRLAGR